MKSPNGITVPDFPTWMNTISNHARKFVHINEFAAIAGQIGYTFILWNNHVYYVWELETGGQYMETDTGWVGSDVDHHTHYHYATRIY